MIETSTNKHSDQNFMPKIQAYIAPYSNTLHLFKTSTDKREM